MARILLVHGAFGRAANWDRVAPGLRAAGHEVEAIDLPGQGDDPTPVAEVTLDKLRARECARRSRQDRRPCSSVTAWAGWSSPRPRRSAPRRRPARVRRGVSAPDGESLIDLTQRPEGAGDAVQAGLVVEGDPPMATMPPEAAREGLMHCCDDEAAAWAASLRGSQPVAPFTHPWHIDGPGADAFAALPRAYVMCLQDRAIKPALQRLMLERAGCDPVLEIDTDHSVWASRPDELVAALDRLAT